MKRIGLVIIGIILFSFLSLKGQIINPIKWNTQFVEISTVEGVATFTATIDDGWHLYAMQLPDDGPIPTSIVFEKLVGVTPIGQVFSSRPPHEQIDMIFHLKLGWWENNVTLSQRFKIETPGIYEIAGDIKFMGCNDASCLPPSKELFEFKSARAVINADSDSITEMPIRKSHGISADKSHRWKPVEAVSSGDITIPTLGIFALAILSIIFAIVLFRLKKNPKSGSWLNSVKVVLGFVGLALSLKFISVADLAYGWGILDREVFVALWIVIFTLLGFYLLGKIRFTHDSKIESIGVVRFFLALVSLSFSIYMLPGLWGAPLKSLSAFVPPLYTQDFNLYEGSRFTQFSDYDEGMEYAEKNNKPVLINFSGYGCVNCRKMEAAVFENSKVRDVIEQNFVMITLMVDDKTNLDSPLVVKENGKDMKLTTVGDKWSYLQRHKFAANSQPYYAILNGKGTLIAGPYCYDENISKFIKFLDKGIENFNKK